MDSFPNTDYVCKHHVCLPLYPGLKDEEVEYVVDSLKSVLRDVKWFLHIMASLSKGVISYKLSPF